MLLGILQNFYVVPVLRLDQILELSQNQLQPVGGGDFHERFNGNNFKSIAIGNLSVTALIGQRPGQPNKITLNQYASRSLVEAE